MSYVRLSTEWKRCLRQRSLFVVSSALFLPMPENGPQAFDLATLQISLAFSCHAGPYLCLSPLTGNLRRSRNRTVVIRELLPPDSTHPRPFTRKPRSNQCADGIVSYHAGPRC